MADGILVLDSKNKHAQPYNVSLTPVCGTALMMKINRQKEDERRDSDADIMELLQMKSDDVSKTRVLNEKQRSDVR